VKGSGHPTPSGPTLLGGSSAGGIKGKHRERGRDLLQGQQGAFQHFGGKGTRGQGGVTGVMRRTSSQQDQDLRRLIGNNSEEEVVEFCSETAQNLTDNLSNSFHRSAMVCSRQSGVTTPQTHENNSRQRSSDLRIGRWRCLCWDNRPENRHSQNHAGVSRSKRETVHQTNVKQQPDKNHWCPDGYQSRRQQEELKRSFHSEWFGGGVFQHPPPFFI
jgi:hypothetical protein